MQVALQHPRPRIKYQLGVVLRSSGQLIGNCGIRMASAGAHEADIGYELSPKQWGKGYATEAASAIVDFGFTELHLHRVWAWCVADNLGSARVLEKIGMRPEGRLREQRAFQRQMVGPAAVWHARGRVAGTATDAGRRETWLTSQ